MASTGGLFREIITLSKGFSQPGLVAAGCGRLKAKGASKKEVAFSFSSGETQDHCRRSWLDMQTWIAFAPSRARVPANHTVGKRHL
jgi:hypothetical protein